MGPEAGKRDTRALRALLMTRECYQLRELVMAHGSAQKRAPPRVPDLSPGCNRIGLTSKQSEHRGPAPRHGSVNGAGPSQSLDHHRDIPMPRDHGTLEVVPEQVPTSSPPTREGGSRRWFHHVKPPIGRSGQDTVCRDRQNDPVGSKIGEASEAIPPAHGESRATAEKERNVRPNSDRHLSKLPS